MAGFGFAGAAAGASDALGQVLAREFTKQQQQQQMALAHAQLEQRRTEHDASLRLQQGVAERATRDQQLQEAGIALGQADAMGPGAELSDALTRQLEGTPFEARVQRQSTLPSRTIPVVGGANLSDPGGRSYSTLIPTVAQQRAVTRAAPHHVEPQMFQTASSGLAAALRAAPSDARGSSFMRWLLSGYETRVGAPRRIQSRTSRG